MLRRGDRTLAPEDHFTFSSLPASRADKRLAFAAILGMFAIVFVVVGPLSGIETARVDAFVPAYTMAMIVTDGITAGLLFAEFSSIRTRALLVIASGYLFSALIVIPWALTYPGAIVSGSVIGGLQSTPYIHFFWHACFPTFVIAYALLNDPASSRRFWRGKTSTGIVLSLVLTAVLVLGASYIFIAAEPMLPRLQRDPLSLNWQWLYLAVPTAVLAATALVTLSIRRHSALDVWLIVVMWAYGIEIALSFFPIPARYSLNWYTGKIFSLLSSSLVLFVLLYEITALYSRLQDALRKAKQADHAKSSFLAAASHDLRQPLQALSSLSGALLPRIQDAEANNAIKRIGHSVDTMNGILNSLLDVNRLESGIARPLLKTVRINDIFDSVAADFSDLAKERGLEFRVVRSRLLIHSDERMLEQMIRNLLSNAIRYTHRGKILMGCRRTADKVRLEVWDSGVGIMGEHIHRIFDEYYQVPSHAELGGVGLGLAIVQRLGKLLDHKIHIRSVPGKGSGFSVEVPLADGSAAAAEEPLEALPGQTIASFVGTILLIDDDHSVRAAFEKLFQSFGLSAVSAASGQDALALVAEKRVNPDLIVTDYNLPGKMNGVDCIESLRETLAWKVPGIVITGETRTEVIEAIRMRGLGIAIKPVRMDELMQQIRQVRSDSNSHHHSRQSV